MSAPGLPPKAQQASITKASNPPNQTLYVRNLNDKIAKDDLRRALYMLFSTHGHILDIVAVKSKKMRGQAHIVFRNVQSSTQAMQALQGFEFLGKEMQIAYGRGRSDIISKLDGTAAPPESSKPPPAQTNKPVFAPPPQLTGASSKAATGTLKAPNGAAAADGSKSPQGTKRGRDEESDEGEPMDEDEGEAMDVSDSD